MANKVEKRGRGRPTKYHPYVKQATEYMARCGLTTDQICEQLNVTRDTFYRWRLKYPELNEAFERGKEEVDQKIEEALRQRALGYMADEYVQERDADGNIIGTKMYKKHIPSNPASTIFWLKNRQPERWREKQEVEMQGRVEFTVLKPEFPVRDATPEIEYDEDADD